MGFKIQHALKVANIGLDGFPQPFKKPSDSDPNSDSKEQILTKNTTLSQSIFDLTAMLIKYEVILLEDIWPHIEHTSKKDDSGKDELD